MQFILGALDPEMHTIEQLLAEHKRHFIHATLNGRRVISGNAYVADALSGAIDWAQPVVWVECSVPALRCEQHLVADTISRATQATVCRQSVTGKVQVWVRYAHFWALPRANR